MKTINFCVTCKGRLWQLMEVLSENLLKTNENVSINILDYHSEDGLEYYIKTNFKKELKEGHLKYFKILTILEGFDMALAKHLIHTISEGEVLFNLDADNKIGDITIEALLNLKPNTVLIPSMKVVFDKSRCGRIGIHKEDYIKLGGYDITITGMKDDDRDLVHRAFLNKMSLQVLRDDVIPIAQTEDEKMKYQYRTKTKELPKQILIEDYKGKIITVNLKDKL